MSNQEKSFEQTLDELKAVVNQLERGDLSLEDAMERYTNGITLARNLNGKIKESKLKIKELQENNG